MLELIWPWALALAPLPLIYRWLRKPADVRMRALRAPLLANAAGASSSAATSSWRRSLLLLVLIVIWLCTLLAIARPVWIGDPVSLPTSGRDILLAVDSKDGQPYSSSIKGRRSKIWQHLPIVSSI